MFHHVFENGAADRDLMALSRRVYAITIAPRRWLQFPGFIVQQHHTAAVRFHPIKDEIQDSVQDFVKIIAPADRDRRQVHDFK